MVTTHYYSVTQANISPWAFLKCLFKLHCTCLGKIYKSKCLRVKQRCRATLPTKESCVKSIIELVHLKMKSHLLNTQDFG